MKVGQAVPALNVFNNELEFTEGWCFIYLQITLAHFKNSAFQSIWCNLCVRNKYNIRLKQLATQLLKSNDEVKVW